MPDILHWLGIKKIDRMLSMSNMKHDAVVEQGIPILERIPIPEGWLSIQKSPYSWRNKTNPNRNDPGRLARRN